MRPSASVAVGIETAGAPSGALNGALGPSQPGAAVPLAGPGTWTLTAGAAVRATLSCPSGSGPVVGVVTIPLTETCQLVLTTADPTATSPWRLTPSA